MLKDWLKARVKGWFLLLLCVVAIAIFVALENGFHESFELASSMSVSIIIHACIGLALLFFGMWLEKKGLDRKRTIAIVVIIALLVGILMIFYRSEKKVQQMQEQSGTLGAVEHTVINAEDVGLVIAGIASTDRGESHWKSWLDYTVTLQSGGVLQYNCERYVDAEDAKGRLEAHIQSDSTGKEWMELFSHEQYLGLERFEAYEWIMGDDSRIREMYYYLQAKDMVLRVKLRDVAELSEDQCRELIDWFLKNNE